MDNELPLVSIITPSLNQGSYIEETILSVKNQTYKEIEYIVIDGGSTDETLDILRKYSDSLTWISEPDKGQSDAINKGWRMSKGKIIAYLNSDDTYMPWAVETAVKFFTEHPYIAIVYGDCNIINEHGNVLGRLPGTAFNLADLICGECMIPQPTAFLRRQVIQDIGLLDVNLYMSMDFDLWIRTGLKFKVEYIPKVLANFRMCPGTKSVDELLKFCDDDSYVLNKLFADPELPKQIRDLKRRAYSGIQLKIGIRYHSLPQMKEARKHFMKAFMLYPLNFLKSPWPAGYLITSFLGAKATEIIVKYKRKLQSSYHQDKCHE